MPTYTSIIPAEFILAELTRAGVGYKSSGDHAMIVCPFHNDSNPSLGISLGGKVPAGVWHCLGCKRSGTWNELAQRIGMRVWDKNSVSDVLYITRTKKSINSTPEVEDPLLSPWNGRWKSYGPKFLRKFGAKKLWDPRNREYYLYLPMTYIGEYYGYVRARLHEDSPGPKYWFPPNITKPMYPIDYLLEYDTRVVVLVEGVGDALRCLRYGLPALAILGTSVTTFMREQLETLGAETLIICMDGDEAGYRAVFGYKSEAGSSIPGLVDELHSEYDIRVLFPPVPDLTEDVLKHDPDSMPYTYIEVLKHLVVSNGGSLLTHDSKG